MATDTFDRANGALGANWTDSALNAGGGHSISGNNAVESNSGFTSWDRYTAETPADDQYSQLTLVTPGSADAGLGGGPAVRMGAGETGYMLRINTNSTEELVLERVDGASGVTSLGGNSTLATPTASDVGRIEVQATTVRGYKNGALVLTSGSDSTYSSGNAGMGGMDYNVQMAYSAWEGGSLVVAEITQAEFRFYDDDGDEDGSTALAAQNTDISLAPGDVFHHRALLQATGDPATIQFRQEYSWNSGGWRPTLTTQPVLAVPSYVGKGSMINGAGAIVVPTPAGIAAGDILVLAVSTLNQAITTPTGYTEVANSPQATGTANTAGAVRLGVFTKVSDGTETDVTVADAGALTIGILFAFRNVDTGAIINASAGSVDAATTSSLSCPAVTTTVDKCLVVNIIGLDKDANDTDTLSSVANASLSSVTERHDQTVLTGAGGGVALITGEKTTAGGSGNTTATGDSPTTHAYVTIALTPATPPDEPVLLDVGSGFITAGGVNTTSRLSGGSGSFTTGRGAYDENPLDTVNIGNDGYTEVFHVNKLISGVVEDADTLDFRYTANGVALDNYDEVGRVTVSTGGGGVDLTVGGDTHSHTADSPSLTQANSLVVQDSSHGHTGESPALTQQNTLAPQGADHPHTADSPTLSTASALAVNDGLHDHASDSPALTQANTLAPQGADHSQSSETVALTQANILAALGADHAHAAESPALTQANILAPEDSQHSHASDNAVLEVLGVLIVQDSQHGHQSESVVLVQQNTLAVQGDQHGHTSETVALAVLYSLTVQDSQHGHNSDSVVINAGYSLLVSDSQHAHLSENPELSQQFALLVQGALHGHLSEAIELLGALTPLAIIEVEVTLGRLVEAQTTLGRMVEVETTLGRQSENTTTI